MLGAGIISLQVYCRDRYIRPAALQGSEAEQLRGCSGSRGVLEVLGATYRPGITMGGSS
jgi:hypothetical protein